MTKYVAFLRGINVGGHKPVKMEELKKTFESFKNIKVVTPQTKFYITFLSEKLRALKIPYESIRKEIKIVHVSASEVCSVLTLSPNQGTTDLMRVLEKEFGRKVTTRNWNTVAKILKG